MLRPSVLVVALVFAAPMLYQGFTDSQVDPVSLALRFLVAIPIAGVLVGLVRMAAGRNAPPPPPKRKKR